MTMPDQPTPQPSGRTAEEILDEHEFRVTHVPKHWEKTDERKSLDNECQRQLFDALVKSLPKPMEAEAYDHEPVKMYERGYNAAIEKMVKKLAVFFAQPTVNDKPYTADSRAGGVDGDGENK